MLRGGDTHEQTAKLVSVDEPLRVPVAHVEGELVKARVEGEGVGERFERDGARSGEGPGALQVRKHCRELVEISHPRDGDETASSVEVLPKKRASAAQRRRDAKWSAA